MTGDQPFAPPRRKSLDVHNKWAACVCIRTAPGPKSFAGGRVFRSIGPMSYATGSLSTNQRKLLGSKADLTPCRIVMPRAGGWAARIEPFVRPGFGRKGSTPSIPPRDHVHRHRRGLSSGAWHLGEIATRHKGQYCGPEGRCAVGGDNDHCAGFSGRLFTWIVRWCRRFFGASASACPTKLGRGSLSRYRFSQSGSEAFRAEKGQAVGTANALNSAQFLGDRGQAIKRE